MTQKELLHINARVVHFNNAKTGHGLGTIVAYNGVQENHYLKEHFESGVEMAAKVGLLGGVIGSFYDSTRCPYVVQWDNGYKDVYEHDSVTAYDASNPDHDPGPLMKIRACRGGLMEAMETAALVRPTQEGVWDYLCYKCSIVTRADGIKETMVVKPYDAKPDTRIGWGQTYIVTLEGHPVAFTDGPVLQ